MNIPRLLVFLMGAVYSLFVYFLFKGDEYVAERMSAFILPILTLAYLCSIGKKSIYFILFLVLYSLSDLMELISNAISYNVYYFLCNFLCIIAYFSLLIYVAKGVSFKFVMRNYKFSLLVLLGLNVYIAYVMFRVVDPYLEFGSEYFIEISYSSAIPLVLTMGLLNFFYRDNKKAFFILLGTLCLVFSEVLNVAYLYVLKQNFLIFFTITLSLLGFYLLYLQTKFDCKAPEVILE